MPIMMCTKPTFRPQPCQCIRWLSAAKDYDVAADFWSRCASSLSLEEWKEANQKYKYRYAAVIHGELIVAVAAVLPYSHRAWEVAAVGTDGAFQRQGNGRRIVSFVTASILEAVPIATCTTNDDNEPMIRTALSVGFEVVPEDEARQYREMMDAYFANFSDSSLGPTCPEEVDS